METALDAEALELLAKHQHGEITTIDGQPVAILSEDVRIESLKSVLDSYRRHPERAVGFVNLDDQESFVRHVNRQKRSSSVIFASIRRPATARVRAVYDYHDAGAAAVDDSAQPRWCEHGAVYDVPLSDEWLAWEKFAAGGFVAPEIFAEFLEERIADVVPDPATSPSLAALQELLGGTWATPLKLIELSRGLQLNIHETVKQASSLSSGEISVTYAASHTDGAGAPLRVPSLFAVGIPILHRGVRYQIAMRLRYRSRGGAVSWAIVPHRMGDAWEHAIDEMLTGIRDSTELPVFRGTHG